MFKQGFIAVAALLFVFAPVAHAQVPVGQFQPQTQAEMIAYLHGILAQLQSRVAVSSNTQFGATTGGQVLGTNTSNQAFGLNASTDFVRGTDDDSTILRGFVDLEDAPFATVWFEFGDGDVDDDTTQKQRISGNGVVNFSVVIDDLDERTLYYYRAVVEEPNGDRDFGNTRSFLTTGDRNRSSSSSNDDEPDARTQNAREIEDDEAELRGSVDMNDFRNGIVFFVYGEDEDAVEDAEDEDSFRDVDEDGDDLQKERVDSDLDGDEDYEETVDGLDEDTEYFFRICVEYEDEDDDETLECGNVLEFDTDDNGSSSNDDEPDARTQSAREIEDDEAQLRGEVFMNDFNNGIVFFIYGEDEDAIKDVEDEDSFNDVDEDGDDLQKERVDNDLDGNGDYEETVTGLDDNTEHFFRICVEYEDEDDDEALECGNVLEFETDQ